MTVLVPLWNEIFPIGNPGHSKINCTFYTIAVDFSSWVCYSITTMKLLTKEIEARLVKAGYRGTRPVCKLFTPWGSATWLITGIEDGILYGYADLGMGCVEHGSIATIEEMESIKGPFQLKIERDRYWSPPDKEVEYWKLDSLVGA
jgi:hypothetical protein